VEAAGGALIDLGAHPLYVARLLLGLPSQVTAVYGAVTAHPAEDNAVVVLTYPSGAIGVAETSFVNRAAPFMLELHGTEGSAIYTEPTARIAVGTIGPDNTRVWSDHPVPAEGLPSPFSLWLDDLRRGPGRTATE